MTIAKPHFYWLKIGGSEWESNPPSPSEITIGGFEDRESHRTPCASISDKTQQHTILSCDNSDHHSGISMKFADPACFAGSSNSARGRQFIRASRPSLFRMVVQS